MARTDGISARFCQNSSWSSSGRPILQSYLDKFFLRLLHNLFDSEEQFKIQVKDLSLNFESPCYAAAHCEILEGSVQEMTKAFEEFDTSILYDTLTQIIDLFRSNPLRYLQAIDGTCNILYLALSLLPSGEETLAGIFADDADNYRSIYRMGNVEQVSDWMVRLRDGLRETLKTKRITYKEHLISNVQKYIRNHIDERLTLNEVAGICQAVSWQMK